ERTRSGSNLIVEATLHLRCQSDTLIGPLIVNFLSFSRLSTEHPQVPTGRQMIADFEHIDGALGLIRPALLMQAHVGDCLFTTAISNAANFITLACLCLSRQNNHQAMALPPSSPVITFNAL